ncbi:MAG: penicillin-binding protein 1A [Alphaproteobacteria bacterium]|nr:penicillin-binding protein 1A [Alphaproteobacteria bacterium]
MLRIIGKSIAAFFSTILLLTIVIAAAILVVLWTYGKELPDYRQLANYEPKITSRFYSGDGSLLSEYAIEKRIFVPIEAMPKRVIHAFISAEDKSFLTHTGVDFRGVVRAILTNIKNAAQGRRHLVGASTITQQVAKNFLLSSERTFDRKIKEAILAFRIEKAFTKQHVLELYLNEIYLGIGSYGVAAAALNYFNKSLDELTLSEIAFLAALPKAPNNYHPVRNHDAALRRRDYVVKRMFEDGIVSDEEALEATSQDIAMHPRKTIKLVDDAEYFTEEVRREIKETYGADALYKQGLTVRTTVDSRMQAVAVKSLRDGLEKYDRAHGWRGELANIDANENWLDNLKSVKRPPEIDANWKLAAVLNVSDNKAVVGLKDGGFGIIPLKELKWARELLEGQVVSKEEVKSAHKVLKVGNVVMVELLNEDENKKYNKKKTDKDEEYTESLYTLRQIPDVEGSLVALDPHTGRVLAMAGGYSYKRSQFNRAIQAYRQPGSSFKPFVYLAALDEGYTPSNLILDAAGVFDQGKGLPPWKPANYSKIFYGPTTLRVGVEKSRNLMTIRLGMELGVDKIAEYAKKFGITDNPSKVLSMFIGVDETTMLRNATAYAMLVNGGKRIVPTLIDRIQDRSGKTIYRHDKRECEACDAIPWQGQNAPELPDDQEQVTNPYSAYQIVSILDGVVQRGTGRTLKSLGRPLAGKTGTTDDNIDAWFMGFSPDLVVGVFVGFDRPKTLGPRDTGGRVAAPIFKEFMREVLKDTPAIPFRAPSGIRLVHVNHKTGKPAKPGDKDVIIEAFKPGTDIYSKRKVIGDDAEIPEDNADGNAKWGGIY